MADKISRWPWVLSRRFRILRAAAVAASAAAAQLIVLGRTSGRDAIVQKSIAHTTPSSFPAVTLPPARNYYYRPAHIILIIKRVTRVSSRRGVCVYREHNIILLRRYL